MKRRKKRPDPFEEIAEAVIALAIETGVTEELVDGIACISNGELELWLVGSGASVCMEADDSQELAVANNSQFGMISSKNRLSIAPLALPMEEVLADVSRLKSGRVNRSKLRLVSSQSTNSTSKRSFRGTKAKKSSSGST